MLIVFSNKKFIIEEDCKEGSKKYFHLRNGILYSNILFELLQVMNIFFTKTRTGVCP